MKFLALKTLNKILLILPFAFLLSFTIQAQDTNQQGILKGQIKSDNSEPLMGANVINLNEVTGETTNEEGEFSIAATVNDTLMISFVGFQSIKLKITQDLLKGNELEVILYEKRELLDQAQVNSTSLIGVLEIDIKQVPQDEFKRIKIDGVPQLYEIGAPKASNMRSPVDAVFHPVDFMYNLFGKKPKQLNKLKKMKAEDQMRDLLADRYDREMLMEYLEMNQGELNNLLDDCKYSDYFINQASDLQLLEALLECYESYKAVKSGTISRDQVPVKNKK